MKPPVELDTRGLLCPMPVIRTQNRLKTMQTGDVLRVICTDPGTLHDIPAWCRVHGHKILKAVTAENEEIIIEVEKLEAEDES